MIFTDRKITIRNGKSTINEPVILYRGDYEVSIRFTIMESKFRFKSGVNLVDSEKASHGQLAILTPYGDSVISEIVKCEDGTVTFTLTKEMIDQLEEVGLYSFQIRLFDYYRESRVSIPPVEFGIEVREPVASEDHNNIVDEGIVGYAIARYPISKVTDGLNEDVPDTFNADGQYNKTDWETGDRISEGRLNKIEDALDQINQNEKNDVAALDKRVTNNFNVLDANKAETTKVNDMQNQINRLVLESGGDSNLEVVQARGDFETLNDRLDAFDHEITDARTSSNGTSYSTLKAAISAVQMNIIEQSDNIYQYGVYSQSYNANDVWIYRDLDITSIIHKGVQYSFTFTHKEQFVNDQLGAIIWDDAYGREVGRQPLSPDEGAVTTFLVPDYSSIVKVKLRLQPVVGTPASTAGTANVSGIQIYEANTKKLKNDISIDKLDMLSEEYYSFKYEMFENFSENIFNLETITLDRYMDGSGNVNTNTTYFMTDRMNIRPNLAIHSSVELRFIVLFDIHGKVVDFYENTNYVPKNHNAVVAVASIHKSYRNTTIMINQGDRLLEFKPYNDNVLLKGFGELSNKVDTINETINEIMTDTFVSKSSNLYNPDTVTLNHYVNDYGTLVANEKYFVTDRINTKGAVRIHTNNNARFISQFDKYGVIIKYDTYTSSVTLDSNTEYVMITYGTELYGQDIMVNIGSELLEFEPFEYGYTINHVKDLEKDIHTLQSNLDLVQNMFDVSPNLANPSEFREGVYISTDGNMYTNLNYFITGLIPVNPGDIVRSNCFARFISLYDENDFLRTFSESVAQNTPYTVEDDVRFIRYTTRIEDKSSLMVYLGDEILEYTPYGELVFDGAMKTQNLQANSLCGSDGLNIKADSIDAGATLSLNSFPNNLKKGVALTFYGKFDTFSNMLIGKGYNSYRGDWINITESEIQWQHYENSYPAETRTTVQHGLSISEFIMVTMHVDDNSKCHVNLVTLSGHFSATFGWGYEYNGAPFVTPGDAMTDVTFNATCHDFRKPVWLFGDSYFGVTNDRVIGQLKNLGYFNFLVNGLAGQNSTGAYNEFTKCLEFGTPKYLVWCLGMNDGDSNYESKLQLVQKICDAKNINLILMKIPSVPARSKEVLNGYVEESGLRYIDAYAAVGVNPDGSWYSGYLSGDGVHPSVIGAKAIAMRILVDVPEILQYGRSNGDSVSDDSIGDL